MSFDPLAHDPGDESVLTTIREHYRATHGNKRFLSESTVVSYDELLTKHVALADADYDAAAEADDCHFTDWLNDNLV